MMAAATIVMSLGTETMNARLATSDHGETADISFAKSFEESSAVAGDAGVQTTDTNILKNAAVTVEGVVLAKSVDAATALIGAKAKDNVNAEGTTKSEPGGTKSLIPATGVKVPGTTSEGVKIKANGSEALSHSGKSNKGAATAIPIEAPDGQPSGSVKDIPPEMSPVPINKTTTDASDGVEAPNSDTAASVISSIPDGGETPVIQNQKKIAIAEEAQEAIPIKKTGKGNDGVAKAEKGEKTAKTEKVEKTVEATGDAVAIAAQTAIGVPVIMRPADGHQHGITAPPDGDSLSSVTSAATGQRAGVAATDNKSGQKHANAEKGNAADIKAQTSSSADDSASRKPGIDEAKTKPAALATPAGDVNALNAAAAAATPIHAEAGSPGAISGVGSGVAPVPVITAGAHAVQAGTHTAIAPTGVGAQVASGASDAPPPLDAAHKTLLATPTSLEVGVANGTHGWLKIRADMADGGVVNASLSTASTSGQDALHRELPSLAAYLQSEHVAVNTVVVQPAHVAAADLRGPSAGMNSNGGGQAQQSGRQGGDNRQDATGTAIDRMEKNVPYSGLNEVGSGELLSPTQYAGGGNWLSVRA